MKVLFEERVNTIRVEADSIALFADLFANLRSNPILSSEYDLRRSAKNLRDAANKLEMICERAQQS